MKNHHHPQQTAASPGVRKPSAFSLLKSSAAATARISYPAHLSPKDFAAPAVSVNYDPVPQSGVDTCSSSSSSFLTPGATAKLSVAAPSSTRAANAKHVSFPQSAPKTPSSASSGLVPQFSEKVTPVYTINSRLETRAGRRTPPVSPQGTVRTDFAPNSSRLRFRRCHSISYRRQDPVCRCRSRNRRNDPPRRTASYVPTRPSQTRA